ncbi:Slp family lipoprotein [Vibrio sp. JPW-9-11-11]|uniref:Slp family lipoprotein n=1 Tax=Vibrio sp. JPW-9-11-11 TaxID=1416532 RepID=UPI0015947B6D|nr:Slp family lipoprotein [Vibrio sp. JPW-9-11-11]NVD07046.1 Slp family lipoprotein [Vibrio sp. JPW-9-11-11]
MYKPLFNSILLSAALIMLAGCSSLPDPLKSDNPDLITEYSVWQANTEASNQVRLGGVVASVANLQQRTRVEVVNLPISSAGKPDINQEPQGRFVAYIDGFADPVTLAPGRLISFIGNSQGREQGLVGQYQYDFPVMNVTGFHLWRIEERVIVHETHSYLEPCFGLHCRRSNLNNTHGKVIKEVK